MSDINQTFDKHSGTVQELGIRNQELGIRNPKSKKAPQQCGAFLFL
jgi:hypothetical protein